MSDLHKALTEYIDAAIEAALDRGDSADGGCVSAVRKSDASEQLRRALEPLWDDDR